MFNFSVLSEIGEAVGNIGRKLFPRRSHADELEESFRRHLAAPLEVHLPHPGGVPCAPEETVIEATFTVISEKEALR